VLPSQNFVGEIDLLVDQFDARSNGRVLQLFGDGLEVGEEPSGVGVVLWRFGDVHVELFPAGAAAESVEADGEGDVGQKLGVGVLEQG